MIKQRKNVLIEGSRDRKIVLDVIWDDDFEERPVVVFCHGYKGFKDWGAWNAMSNYFAEQGFSFVKFNFSYNGGTEKEVMDFPDLEAFSKNNFTTELNDLGKVIDWCIEETWNKSSGIVSDRIFLIGHSRGGAIALLKSAEDKRVKKLCTWAAVADLAWRFRDEVQLKKWEEEGVTYVENARTGQQLPHLYQFYEDFKKNEQRLNPILAAGKIEIPWLIIHPEDDESVPVEHALELSSANLQAELLLLESGGHTFETSHPQSNPAFPDLFKSVCSTTTGFFFGED